MGFATGASIAQDLWDEIEDFIPPICRQEVAQAFVDVFEDYDCDTMEETDVFAIAEGIELEEDEEACFHLDACPDCGGMQLEEVAEDVFLCHDCGLEFFAEDAVSVPVDVECPDCEGTDVELVDICECGAFQFQCHECGTVWEDDDPEVILPTDIVEEE